MSSSKPTTFDPAASILFLGSGFSRQAKNIRNQHLPTHHALREEFAQMLGVAPDIYNVQTLADEIASRPDLNLYQTLYELFTVQRLTSEQTALLRLPWRRVYTTNYDDAIEFSYTQGGVPFHSYTYSDPKPRRLRDRSIIHLHGAIRWATEDNVLRQLVLNEESYARQHFERSPWYEELERDRRFCHAFFFVGYSLNDYHISALLLENPNVSKKTYFVNGGDTDTLFARRVAKYGSVLPLDAAQLPAFCERLPRPNSTDNPRALTVFRYLDPFKDKKTLAPPTPIEILNLVTYGTFNYQRFLSSFQAQSYAVPRHSLLDEAVAKLANARSLLVHSFLGNGKSIFLYSLAYTLSETGYKCFHCRSTPVSLREDLELLRSMGRTALFFDSHNSALDLMHALRDLPPETRFVIAVRSSILDLRRPILEQKLPSPIEDVDLNRISKDDKVTFGTILDRSGVRVEHLEQVINQSKDFREIVTTLYDNAAIKERIRAELEPLLKDHAARRVLVAAHLLRFNGEEASPAVLRAITGSDPYTVVLGFPGIARDVLGLDDEVWESNSALFSEYMLQNHVATQDVTDCAFSILITAVRRRRESRFQAILGKVMRYSRLNRTLSKDPDRSDALAELYERLARDEDVNREPLFWLQYAILMNDRRELLAAERFVTTAYERAGAISNFKPIKLTPMHYIC